MFNEEMWQTPGPAVETKPAPWTLENFIAWLETKPADKTYCYISNGHCLIAQYAKHLGYVDVGVSGGGYYHARAGGEVFHARATKEIYLSAVPEPRTFGAALKRANSLAAGHKSEYDYLWYIR